MSASGRKRGERGRSQATLDLIATSRQLIEPCWPITVRGVAYKLFIIARLIESMEKKNVDRVGDILRIAREEETIPWEWIVDESRSLEWVPAWSNLEAYGEKIARDYRRDFWSDQLYKIIIVSEKATVAGVLNPLLNEYGVSFFAAHGFNSATKIHDLAEKIINDRRHYVFIYVGDWDPSGMFMSEVDFPARLQRYGADPARFTFSRVALIKEDTLHLPSFAAKTADPRYKWYQKLYGKKAWELDAQDPRELRERVRTHIEKYINHDAWQRHRIIEDAQRRTTRKIAAQLAAMQGGDV